MTIWDIEILKNWVKGLEGGHYVALQNAIEMEIKKLEIERECFEKEKYLPVGRE